MTDFAIKNFLPEKLFPSAKEEVLFGSGSYRIGHHMPKTLERIFKAWINFLLEQPSGLMFHVSQFNTSITITLSAFGVEVLHQSGYDPQTLQIAGINTQAKTIALKQIAITLSMNS